ncbi:MAG: glycoside hydrolase family 15 protein [Gallionella sp.]
MAIVHNKTIGNLIEDHYSIDQCNEIYTLLIEQGTFDFHKLQNGLFPAASLQAEAEYTGYRHVWVRDNIYVALAHQLEGRSSIAVENVKTLARYFLKHKSRFEAIIDGTADFNDPMNRPHVRFNGENLLEINQKWAHAQNDALGYFMWLFCMLHNCGVCPFSQEEKELLVLLTDYYLTICYWQDEDSGHWEEARKVESSSIGVVMRGLQEFRILLQNEGGSGYSYRDRYITVDFLDHLIAKGKESLMQILPAESPLTTRGKGRRYDAALLFLAFPMNVVSEEMGEQIVKDVTCNLEGDYGIRRYLGDSFWSANYKKNFKPGERTMDFSDNISARDSLLRPNEEAQWCIFDPIISIIYGVRYQRYRLGRDLQLQTRYFNRSLGQITEETSRFGGFRCPELYYLEEGRYVPNDTVPLLWTQANLWMAFRYLKVSLQLP